MSKITIEQNKNGNGRDYVIIEDAKILTRYNNFSGTNGYKQGDTKRTVSVVIDDEDAVKYFEEHGWNVGTRYVSVKNEDTGEWAKTDEVDCRFLKITVSYTYYDPTKKRPVPTIREIDPDTGAITFHNLDTVGSIDSFNGENSFEHCDIEFKGHPWSMPDGSSGITGYLQWMQFVPRYNPVDATVNRLEKRFENTDEEMPF